MAVSQFLQDDQGKNSAMRAMNFMSLIASFFFGYVTLTSSTCNTEAGVYLTFTFLLGAFAPKALQKFAENNPPKPTE